MDLKIVINNNAFFQVYSHPKVLRIDLFNNTKGIPPSKVPAGQINLQK